MKRLINILLSIFLITTFVNAQETINHQVDYRVRPTYMGKGLITTSDIPINIVTNNSSSNTLGFTRAYGADAVYSNDYMTFQQGLSMLGGRDAYYLRGDADPTFSGFRQTTLTPPTTNWTITIASATNNMYGPTWIITNLSSRAIKQGIINVSGIGASFNTGGGRSASYKWEAYITNVVSGGVMPEWSDQGSIKVLTGTADYLPMTIAIVIPTNITSSEGVVIKAKVTSAVNTPNITLLGGSNSQSEVSLPTGVTANLGVRGATNADFNGVFSIYDLDGRVLHLPTNGLWLAQSPAIASHFGQITVTNNRVCIGTNYAPTTAMNICADNLNQVGLVVDGGGGIGGANTAESGGIAFGRNTGYRGYVTYDANTHILWIGNSYDDESGVVNFFTKLAGTPVTAMTLRGSGNIDMLNHTISNAVYQGTGAGITALSGNNMTNIPINVGFFELNPTTSSTIGSNIWLYSASALNRTATWTNWNDSAVTGTGIYDIVYWPATGKVTSAGTTCYTGLISTLYGTNVGRTIIVPADCYFGAKLTNASADFLGWRSGLKGNW